ncbi:MAG: RnfABCDGE type electron transport complex subunit D [Halanaerobiales bacterium]
MDDKLIVTSSPHVKDDTSVNQIMWSVILALLPAVLASLYYFKINAFIVILVSITGCVITEYLFQKVREQKPTINDGSAILTGLLLALTLPPTFPWWGVLVGSVVAIGLGKQVFGGLGYNPFNPALVGRAFLLAAYPVLMTTWMVDGTSSATPLNLMKMEGIKTDYWRLFIGNVGGSIGETSALALLIGASYLIYKGYIHWRIPAGMIGTVFILSWLFQQDPVFHLFSGGLILGAFYMATDLVTTPVTKTGRWIFGIGAGLIVVIIRLWGGYPEGVMYSILLMNTTVPLLDRYTRPRSLGEVS